MKFKSMLIVFLGLSASCLFAQCCPGKSRTALVAPIQSVEKVENTLPQLLEFGSKRCMACQKMAPIIEALTNDYKGVLRVEFIDVAIREKLAMAHQHKIKTIPTQVFLDAKGKELWRHEGFISREDIEKKWKSLGYDLGELKKKAVEKSTPKAATAQQHLRAYMNRFKIMTLIKNLLLVFVLISIGFASGRRLAAPGSSPAADGGMNSATAVHVYYLHSTFRCTTCNTIEQMTKDLLEKNFKTELDSGFIVFSEVNFQENEKLAALFDVVASCVVVAAEKNGQVIDFLRLDEVWTKLSDRAGFDKYISDAIVAMKKKLEQGETL